MKLFKVILKSIIIIVLVLYLILMLMKVLGVSYKTITQTKNGTEIRIEVKKVFGKRISEATINSEGFYDGNAVTWDIFKKDRIKAVGQYKNGFWHGEWKSYNAEGKIIMIRQFEEGKLIKLFIPKADTFMEIPRDKWPKYADVRQSKRIRARNY